MYIYVCVCCVCCYFILFNLYRKMLFPHDENTFLHIKTPFVSFSGKLICGDNCLLDTTNNYYVQTTPHQKQRKRQTNENNS